MNEIESLFERGLINIDKPVGPTSHKTTEYVMQILGVRKAGHSGTLDPKVSGVLPMALNRATRILEFLLKMPKEYVGVMRLHEDVSLVDIRKTIKKNFSGKIKQTPPRKSAVKREERVREIYEFKILEKKEKEVLFRVKCQAGTYIRKLVHDLGISLGIGAHMLELRRISVGNFKEKDSFTLYELAKAVEEAKKGKLQKLKKIILPIEKAVSHLPKVTLRKSSLQKIKYGQIIPISEMIKMDKSKNEILAGFVGKKFVCLCKPLVRERKKIFKPEKVFI